MRLQKIGLTALLTLVATLTLNNFPVISNPNSLLQNSYVLAQTPADRKAEADRLLQQGFEQIDTNQMEAALQSFQQALLIYRDIKDRRSEAGALGGLGNIYGFLGNFAKTIEYHEQAFAIAKELQDRQIERAALGTLGAAYNALGNYRKAIEYHEQALALARTMKDRRMEGLVLTSLGSAYASLSNYTQAIEYYKQHLAVTQDIQDRQGEGQALNNIGTSYHALGNYAKAVEYLEQSLVITRQLQDREGEGTALSNLGLADISLGNYVQGIKHIQESLAIAREIQNPDAEGKALGNLGNAYLALGDYAKAINYYEQTLAIAKRIQNPDIEGSALMNLGNTYNSLGDYNKAIEYLEQGWEIAKARQDRASEGIALNNLGRTYDTLGDYAKAIDYLEQSLAIAKSIQDRQSESNVLGNLGNVYSSLGKYNQALDYYQQNLAIAKAIQDRKGEGQALINLGFAYRRLGNYAKAIEYQQQSLAIAKAIQDRETEGLALNNLGLYLYKSGNLTAAETTLFEAINVWESLRFFLGSNDTNKVSIFEEQARTYRHLQGVLIAQNKIEQALEIAERGRARAFVELVSKRLSSSPTEQDNMAPPNIEQIKQIAKAKDSTLVQYSIIYDEFNVEGQQQTQESELYIWVVKPTGEVTFRKADLKPLWQQQNTTLAELVTNSRESIGVRSRGIIVVSRVDKTSQAKQLQQLHRLLIQPIADLLPTDPNQRIIFIPQQSLFLVPFPALQDESGKYLIEKHTILTAPSIQVLELTRQQRERLETQPLQTHDALVVGNPIMPSVSLTLGEKPQQLPSLPGAQKEAQAIAPLLNTKALIGKDATKIAVEQLMPKARIIHLATHGLLDDVRGLGSALALTPSGSDDGLLTAEQILELQLNAELVVLSACDTGRGRITGDGVIGLSRSLISAGVPSVIVSLWSVPDAPTASLMTEFYQNLQNNPDKAQALRQAMLTTMKQHPNPRDWAAFTLIGEAQ